MRRFIVILFLCTLFFLSKSQFVIQEHSLVGPFKPENLNDWYLTGTAKMTDNYIQLTSNEPNKQGAIWNIHPFSSPDWEFQIDFVVHGPESKSNGDGFAIWYAKEPLHLGPVFGSKDYFSGLGVFVDTFEDTASPHKHSHPYISAMVNNGTSKYHHDEDGTYTEIGGCYAAIRNRDFITRMAIAYIDNTLSVFTDTDGTGLWNPCFTSPGVHLPTGYNFGISASTSDRTDNHNIVSITGMEYNIARENVASLAYVVPKAEFHQPPKEYTKSQQNLDQILAETLLQMQDEERKNEKQKIKEAEEAENKKKRIKKDTKEETKQKKEKVTKTAKSSPVMDEHADSATLLRKIIYITGAIIIIVVGISTCKKYFTRRRESMQKRLY